MHLRKSHLLILCIGILLAAAPALALADAGDPFRLRSISGKRFDSRKHPGPIVISFFFVDCLPCIKEVPQLHALIGEQYPQAALLFVDPIADDNKADIEDFADRLEVPPGFFYRDPLGRFAKRYFKGKFIFPTIVGFRDGKYLFRVRDLSPESLEKIRQGLEG